MNKKPLFFFAALFAVNAHALDLVKDSKAVSKIYLDPADLAEDGEKNPLRLAVEDLNYHLQKISGASLEVVQAGSPDKISGPALALGSLAAKAGAAPAATRWREGYRIVVEGNRALVAGENPQATAHGIYALLNELGCDWVMPGELGEILPRHKTLTLDKQDQASSPDFGFRDFWYNGGPNLVSKEERAEHLQWTCRQRLGGSEIFRDGTGQGHVWGQLIKKYNDRFAADPEMLALVRLPDGTLKRNGPQIETTNPKVVELMAGEIRSIFEKRGWPKEKAVTLPIGPADGDGYSVSAESLTVSPGRRDPMAGGEDASDLLAKFANDVLGILGKEYPNLSLGYYVYGVHGDFPALHKPHPRIYPVFAPISYSRLHSTEDPHSKTRAYYRGVLEQWVKLAKEQGNRYMAYEYNWNLADNMLPFTRVKMLAEEIALYHRLGFEGFILESTKAWAINGPGDYIAARLVWDTSQDWKELLREYCEKSFGPAGDALESYYLRLADLQTNAGREAGSYFSAPLIFDQGYLAAAQADVDKALARELTPEQRLRVEAAVYPLSTLKHYLAWHEALGAFDFAKAEEHYDAILAEWQAMLDKNPQFVARVVPPYMKGLMRGSTVEGRKYSSAPYEAVFRLPDALPTALDPTGNGERMNLAGPEINDSDWIKTRTYGSTWDAQGLGFYRDGAVWYRTRFEVPKKLEGKALGLFLGGFEDEARVWINGKALGSSGIKFANPAVFDLTDGIRYGAENTLAIQIVRNSKLNEILLGGLLRPSFIFAGPRVEVGKPGAPEYRVLPGGEREPVVP